jgi:TetR/AcrR family transcriptional regulator
MSSTTEKKKSSAASAPRSRDPERTRAAILLAAREEFAERGFFGARTGRIARIAGVPQGLLYHYFENKEALLQAVKLDALEPYFRATIDLLEKHPGDGRPDRLLETAIRLYFDFLRRNPHVSRLMAWWVAERGWEEGAPLPEDDELCNRPMQLGVERIVEGQRAGFIKPELDPEAVIRSFLALCDHWHMTFGQPYSSEPPDPNDPAALDRAHDAAIDHIVNLVLHGVLTERGAERRRERLAQEASTEYPTAGE